MLSVVISPYLLRWTLEWAQKRKQQRLTIARGRREGDQPVYFCIHAIVHENWRHQEKLLMSLFNLNLGIVDCRSWRSNRFGHKHHKPRVMIVGYLEVRSMHYPIFEQC